jgi:3-keto-disaccharide hydrolase/PA14 domain
MKKIFYLLLMCIQSVAFAGNDDAKTVLPLDDLSSFKKQAGNWRIVGGVQFDPTVDVHVPADQVKAVTDKAVSFQPGSGILLNINDDKQKDKLLTTWKHGDIELEFDVMLPKGSNSGIYLQGRYEVQLFDSWGVKHPKFSDIGGIYRNWKSDKENKYSGKAPLSNPAKAPGLWQTMKISFRAPKFNWRGKKIANARFAYVELNGVVIHRNVEVSNHTGGPISTKEAATGPLMIQGDHGPVAIRNFKYNHLTPTEVSLGDLAYKLYTGEFTRDVKLASLTPARTGKTPVLSVDMVDGQVTTGVIFSGLLDVEKKDRYEFALSFNGGGRLVVDGKTLIDVMHLKRNNDKRTAIVDLDAGKHEIEIRYYKLGGWSIPALGLSVKGASSHPLVLNDKSSGPLAGNPTAPKWVTVGSEPKLLRGFLDFKGKTKKRFSHTIGVGGPTGVHYAYDLESGNVVCVWRGGFVDTTPMWNRRGDGSFRPLGALQCLFAEQPLAYLNKDSDVFPAAGERKDYRSKGYVIDESTGQPVFKYIYNNLKVADKVYPSEQHAGLTREITIENRGKNKNLYFKLGEGSDIVKMDDGTFAMDGQQYYIKIPSNVTTEIRSLQDRKELVVRLDASTLKYNVIW